MDEHLDERWTSDLPRGADALGPTKPAVEPGPVIVPSPEEPPEEPLPPDPEPLWPPYPGVLPDTVPAQPPVPGTLPQPIHPGVPFEIPGPVPQPIHEPVT